VEFDLGEERSSATTKTITLALAVFKFDRMEWAIEKCTELGVARVIPVIAQRTESHLAMAAAKRAERWRRIARESSEQSRRAGAPEICDPMKLKELLGVSAALRIVLSESQPGLALKDALIPAEDVILALGPEGGWTDAESKLFQDRGWTPASLGQTVLRAETAAIAALVIVLSESW
jgi:16S rRNA (uracil1498-N3)-methyltransferase